MSKIIQYILAILGIFLVTFAAKAGDESYVNSLKGDEIRVGNSNVTEDIWYAYMQNNNDWENISSAVSKQNPFARDKRFSNYDANAYVSLRWEGTDGVKFDEKWYYKVTVLVKGWDADGNQIGNEQRTLNIDYNPEHASSFKDWDALKLPNIHRVEVTIRKIEFSNDEVNYVSQGVVGNKFEDLYLETKVEIERYFSLDLEESLGVWRQNINTADRTVTYAWDYLEGAELYDFEWVYVFSETHLEGTGTPDVDWDRATRVTLENNHYSLELPYEEGYVYVRVRAVSYANPAHQRIMTDWEYEEILRILETGGDIIPFESNAVDSTDKNWSYQAQYAEHGKRSEVISFFDGTGRLRQTITKDNSTGNVLVAETVFDYEGREAISISPSPSGNSQMKFYQNYNLNTASPAKPFSAVDFDQDIHYDDPVANQSPLSTSSGSSRYFSSQNPAANLGNMAYVPDADGHPYARTTIDNQGRIKTQAGAGENYKKGSGHETEFYYGSVFQENLDQLFGAEVGYAEHYRMKAVKDANGQLSVAYENLAGQTIATALVGGAPTDDLGNPILEDLDPNNDNYSYAKSRPHTVDFTAYNRTEGLDTTPQWVIHRELAFISDGDYDFTYTFDPSQYTGCGNGNCNYELQFLLLDDEGNELSLSDNDSYVSYTPPSGLPSVLDEPFTLGSIGQTQISFTLTIGAGFLEQGSYILEKRLRLVSVDEQVADFEEQLREDFSLYMTDPSSIPNCFNPTTLINEITSSIDLECYTEGGNQTTILDLLDPNGDVSPGGVTCDVYRQLLLNDVSPGGQYFDNIRIVIPGVSTGGGNQDYWLNSTTLNPSDFDASFSTWAEVRGNWQEEWAEILLPEHPEYCQWQTRCYDANGNETWFEQAVDYAMVLSTVDSISAVIDHSYINASLASPPYLAGSTVNDLVGNYTLVAGESSAPYQLKEAYADKILNYSVVVDPFSGTTISDMWEVATSNSSLSHGQTWEAYKGLYLAGRNYAYDEYIDQTTSCGFQTVTGTLNGHEPLNSDGYVIRFPKTENLTDILTVEHGLIQDPTTGISSTSQLTTEGNALLQENAICGFSEASVTIGCKADFTTMNLSIQLGANAGGQTLSLGALPANPFGNDPDCSNMVEAIQAHLDNTIAGLSPSHPLEAVVSYTENGIHIAFRFAGQELAPDPTTGITDIQDTDTYAGSTLLLNSVQTATFETVACDLGIEICLCAEIDQLLTEAGEDPDNLTDRAAAFTIIRSAYKNTIDVWVPIDIIEDIYDTCQAYNPVVDGFTYNYVTNYFANALTDIVTVNPDTAKDCIGCEELHCWEMPEEYTCEDEEQDLIDFYVDLTLDGIIEQLVDNYRQGLVASCFKIGDPQYPHGIDGLTMNYMDTRNHFMLYYYDAAGNKVRTVPPTGVVLLDDISQVENDRKNGVVTAPTQGSTTHTVPAHRMVTYYQYNTLGEVVITTTPDRESSRNYYDNLGRPVATRDGKELANGECSYIVYDAQGRVVETGVLYETGATITIPDPLSGGTVTIPFTLDYYFGDPSRWKDDFDEFNDNPFPNQYVADGFLAKKEVREIVFDENPNYLAVYFEDGPQHLRNRVAAQTYSQNGVDRTHTVAFSYDVLGNAKEIWQVQEFMSPKQMLYDFDLIAGVVNEVKIQDGRKDQLSYRYKYDANNRLVRAESSLNHFMWNTDAAYEYYDHGPLARIEIGDEKVQAMDYIYTLQGWIKSVNSTTLDPSKDPGQDGSNNSNLYSNSEIHSNIAQDIWGYGVHYFDGDYSKISNTSIDYPLAALPSSYSQQLFNGNISSVTLALTAPEQTSPQQPLDVAWKKYRYDQLQRIRSSKIQLEDITTLGNTWATGTDVLQTDYTYDPNGNIRTLKRHDEAGNLFDQFSYNYAINRNSGEATAPNVYKYNRLFSVDDLHTNTNTANNDLEDQDPNNYAYNENGALIQDDQEDIADIEWLADGKIYKITRTAGSNKPNLEYRYDFGGNRLAKIVKPQGSNQQLWTVYLRDAQGNVVNIYESTRTPVSKPIEEATLPVYLKEQVLYGSNRLGVIRRNSLVQGYVLVSSTKGEVDDLDPKGEVSNGQAIQAYYSHLDYGKGGYKSVSSGASNLSAVYNFAELEQGYLENDKYGNYISREFPVLERLERTRGFHQYELSNFRMDVRQVISDIKVRVDDNEDGLADAYEADVLQVSDTYPFGWNIQSRSKQVSEYRYAYNGMEKDAELSNGNFTTLHRGLDSRIARWWSTDPVTHPYQSPYCSMNGNPVTLIDPKGDAVPFIVWVIVAGAGAGAADVGIQTYNKGWGDVNFWQSAGIAGTVILGGGYAWGARAFVITRSAQVGGFQAGVESAALSASTQWVGGTVATLVMGENDLYKALETGFMNIDWVTVGLSTVPAFPATKVVPGDIIKEIQISAIVITADASVDYSLEKQFDIIVFGDKSKGDFIIDMGLGVLTDMDLNYGIKALKEGTELLPNPGKTKELFNNVKGETAGQLLKNVVSPYIDDGYDAIYGDPYKIQPAKKKKDPVQDGFGLGAGSYPLR